MFPALLMTSSLSLSEWQEAMNTGHSASIHGLANMDDGYMPRTDIQLIASAAAWFRGFESAFQGIGSQIPSMPP